MTSLFIPEKIRVGFKNRNDTYTKKLAYVVYFDAKNKLRKETSWESWRDKNIPFEDFENKPHGGFFINKNVERYNWSHFSSNRTYIRIYDDRGIEFEVTPENLIGILMHSDCLKRQLVGDFVYAWSGKELVLLPVNSEEYQKAKNYTALQHSGVSAKDLKVGYLYKTKKNEDVVYMGRFNWYERNFESKICFKKKKKHIFISYQEYSLKKPSEYFLDKSDVSFLASQNSVSEVPQYADLAEKLSNDNRILEFKGLELAIPSEFEFKILSKKEIQNSWSYNNPPFGVKHQNLFFQEVSPDVINIFDLEHRISKEATENRYDPDEHLSFRFRKIGFINKKDFSFTFFSPHGYGDHWDAYIRSYKTYSSSLYGYLYQRSSLNHGHNSDSVVTDWHKMGELSNLMNNVYSKLFLVFEKGVKYDFEKYFQ